MNVIAAIDTIAYTIVPIGINRLGIWHYYEPSQLLQVQTGATPHLPKSDTPVSLVPGGKGSLINCVTGKEVASIDVAFPLLHGPYGEDGTVQGLLQLADLPFVGADVLGSAVGMDKDVMKRLLRDANIPIAQFRTLRRQEQCDPHSIVDALGLPVFVKPANLGSSVGVSKAATIDELTTALETAFTYDKKIIVEEAVEGREIECAVLGNEEPTASVLGEIIPAHDFYSYEAKYLDEHGAALAIPADLPEANATRIRTLAINVSKR
jgi:D-alanine-D-alanine ligase and related ATP-grasp enzymes